MANHQHNWQPLTTGVDQNGDSIPIHGKYRCADVDCAAIGYRNHGQTPGKKVGDIIAYRCNRNVRAAGKNTCGEDAVTYDDTFRRTLFQRCRAHIEGRTVIFAMHVRQRLPGDVEE